MADEHYTLVASLPWLPPFEAVEHVPMSHKQLVHRLRMLPPRDFAELERAQALVRWQWHPIDRTSADVRADYRELMTTARQPSLKDYVAFRFGQRSAMAALRLRRLGAHDPPDDDTWVVGPLARRLRTHWNDEDLGLRYVFAWLPAARQALMSGDAVGLERVLMQASWRRLSATADSAPFGFEAVLAFTFKLDIIQRWLSFDAGAARTRFRALVEEVTRDREQIFG